MNQVLKSGVKKIGVKIDRNVSLLLTLRFLYLYILITFLNLTLT